MTYRTTKLGIALLCAVTVSGCGFFRSMSEPQIDDQIQVTRMDGTLGLDADRYVYAFHAGGTPMGESYGEGRAFLAPMSDSTEVPILTVGRADGSAMSQADKNEIRRVAMFLCSERPDWARASASGDYPDWLENGQWHLVAPCK